MTRILTLIVLLALAPMAAAKAGDVPGYKGADGGVLVLSGAIAPAPLWLVVNFSQADGRKKSGVFAQPFNMFMKADFAVPAPPRELLSSRQQELGFGLGPNGLLGQVLVRRLPPGRYKIYEVRALAIEYGSTGRAQVNVSIPFEIKPGRTTYVGAFEAYPVTPSTNGGRPLQYLVLVRNAKGRDFSIASATYPQLGELDDQVGYDGVRPLTSTFANVPPPLQPQP